MARKPIILIAVALALIPALAAAWWLLSPLFITKTIDEEFPRSVSAEIPSNMSRPDVEAVMADAAAEPDSMADETMPEASPAVVKSGTFRDADSFHRGSGTATVYNLADGSRVLRLEEFSVTNGPDLHVILSNHPNPTIQDEVKGDGYADLGSLKGNAGNQNYDIPSDVDISALRSVVIYCMPFHVVFSVATLEDAG